EQAVKKADSYLRREDTRLARGLKRVVPKEGQAYVDSWQNKVLNRATAGVIAVYTIPLQVAIAGAIEVEGLIKEKRVVSVIYRAPRVGPGGREFKAWKFRTLYEG